MNIKNIYAFFIFFSLFPIIIFTQEFECLSAKEAKDVCKACTANACLFTSFTGIATHGAVTATSIPACIFWSSFSGATGCYTIISGVCAYKAYQQYTALKIAELERTTLILPPAQISMLSTQNPDHSKSFYLGYNQLQ